MDVAGAELARVLVPGGILAGLRNITDDRVSLVAGLERVSGGAAIGARDLPSSWRAETAGLHLPSTGMAARFGSPEGPSLPARCGGAGRQHPERPVTGSRSFCHARQRE